MKKKCFTKFLLILTLILVSLLGCTRKENEITQTNFDDQKKYLNMSNWTESDAGIYYIQSETGYDVLKYIDKKTAKETVLCQKLNCKHHSKDCPAVCEDGEIMSSMAYANGKLYYMVLKLMEEPMSLDLYCMNQDGTGKELLHKFENQWSIPNGAGIYKGKLFFAIPTMEQFEDGTGAISSEPSLIMYDLESCEETLILDGREENGKFVVPCGGSGDSIYFWEIGFYEDTGCIFKRYDFNEKKITTILEAEKIDIQLIRDDMIYIQSVAEKKIQSYHANTMEYEDVLEWTDDISTIYVKDGYLELIKETVENEETQFDYNWYDLKNGKYLFEEYQSGEEYKVIGRVEQAYWIVKEEDAYLYYFDSGEWKKIEEIG